MNSNFFTILFAIAATSCSTKSAQPDAHSHHHYESRFFSLVNLSSGNYLPKNLEKLTNSSASIFVGRIKAVYDGRTMDFAVGESNPMFTSVLEFTVDETVKGEPASTIYVEIYRAEAITSADLAASIPKDTMVVFAAPAYWNDEVYKYSYPDGAYNSKDLYRFTTPQGLLLEEQTDSGPQIIMPLEGAVPFFPKDDGPAQLVEFTGLVRQNVE